MASRKNIKIKELKKSPVTSVPRHTFSRRGFGIGEVEPHEWRSRIRATEFVLDVIKSRRLPENSLEMHHCMHTVKGMFWHIYIGDGYDWFSTSRFLGHPSAELCKQLSLDVAAIKIAARTQDDVVLIRSIDRFTQNFGDEMLENYLRMAVDNGHLVREEGWAYILWSSSERDVVHIGAASGQVEDVIRRLDEENPGHHPYGVLAAWLVHDISGAYQDIHRELEGHHLDHGFFRVDFGVARDRISLLLKDTDNFALSPWHDYQLEREIGRATSAPRLKMAG